MGVVCGVLRRIVHGAAAENHSVWGKEGDGGDGDQVHMRTHRNVGCITRRWPARR